MHGRTEILTPISNANAYYLITICYFVLPYMGMVKCPYSKMVWLCDLKETSYLYCFIY